MSKFVSTTYSSPKEILKLDHYVAMGVTVGDTDIVANTDGKKIVPAGSILGSAGNVPILLDENQLAKECNTPSTPATAIISFGVPVAEDTITVGTHVFTYVASNPAAGQFTSAAELTALINATDDFTAVNADGTITVTSVLEGTAANSLAHAKTGTGTETISAFTGGTDGTGLTAEGVLLEDVDVTYGPASGSMVIHGFVDISKLPEVPSVAAKTALTGRIVFLK